MWQYNQTPNDKLMHYGVKGMKWGVRRDRAKRARMGQRLKERADLDSKTVDNLKKKRSKMVFDGKDTSKLDSQINQISTRQRNTTKLMNRTISGLSQKEIDRGRRYVTVMRYAFGGVGEAVNQARVERYIKRNS